MGEEEGRRAGIRDKGKIGERIKVKGSHAFPLTFSLLL
jgi:hypothetical protein